MNTDSTSFYGAPEPQRLVTTQQRSLKSKKMKRILMGLAFSLIAIAGNAQAEVVLTENFDYSDGNLVGNGGWAAHSASGTNPVQVLSGQASLSHGGGSREDVSLSFAEVTSGTVRYEFDLVVNDDAAINGTDFEYFAHLKDDAFGFTARLDIVSFTGSDFSLGIASGDSTADATLAQGFTFGDTVSVLVDYNIDTMIASLSVGAETIVGDIGQDLNVSSFALRQSNSTSDESILVDNLRVSKFAAVPEPGSAALLGLLSFGAVAVRRRRS